MKYRVEGFMQLLLHRALPPKDHVSRKAWREKNGDPVKWAILTRVFGLVGATLLLGGAVVLNFDRTQGFGIFLVASFVGLLCLLIGGLSDGAGAFFSNIYKACDLLDFTPKEFAGCGGILNRQAKLKLLFLGQVALETADAYDDPRDPKRVGAMAAFEKAYQVFLELGLIRNDGYGRYFQKTRKVLYLTRHSDGFGIRLRDSNERPMVVSYIDPQLAEIDQAIGHFVRTHPNKLDLPVQWDPEQTFILPDSPMIPL